MLVLIFRKTATLSAGERRASVSAVSLSRRSLRNFAPAITRRKETCAPSLLKITNER
jgi:hypothetical protein